MNVTAGVGGGGEGLINNGNDLDLFFGKALISIVNFIGINC